MDIFPIFPFPSLSVLYSLSFSLCSPSPCIGLESPLIPLSQVIGELYVYYSYNPMFTHRIINCIHCYISYNVVELKGMRWLGQRDCSNHIHLIHEMTVGTHE